MSAQQNLVPNGSFEDTLGCPNNFDQIYKTKYWYKPTQGTSDYYNACDLTLNTSVPFNVGGFQIAHNGFAYAGISFGDNNYPLEREYLQVKLLNKLQRNKKYSVEFWLSRADSTNYAVSNIGAVISQNPISCSCSTVLNFNPQIKQTLFITESINWQLISGDYIANGDEEYLTIGHFGQNYDTLKVFNGNFTYTYYYVDDISIVASEVNSEIPNIFTPNADGSNDVFCFDTNIYKANELSIYNRWGNKVFESKNNFTWDGRTTSGEPCNAGTYYYIIQTETETYKGFLELVR